MKITPHAPRALAASPLVNTTRSFYQVLTDPAPLAGMKYPKETPWPWIDLQSAGFNSVVCLTDSSPQYDPAPLKFLYAAEFQDQFGGHQPRDPTREAEMLFKVIRKLLAEMVAGRGVVVHCQGGTGRTGTVIACTLRAMGVSVEDVRDYMDSVNRSRGKSPGWPESIWQKRQMEQLQISVKTGIHTRS